MASKDPVRQFQTDASQFLYRSASLTKDEAKAVAQYWSPPAASAGGALPETRRPLRVRELNFNLEAGASSSLWAGGGNPRPRKVLSTLALTASTARWEIDYELV
jgi:hypothetical protein